MENFSSPDVTSSTSQDLIAKEVELGLDYTYASTGQRFLNLLIDSIIMRFGLDWATGYLVGIFLSSVAPDFLSEAVYGGVSWQLLVLSYLISILNYLFYYTLCEKLFKGVTLGKLITGTKAVRENGENLSLKDALLRSLTRLVPFEAFSAFNGHPWHDRWTKTMVIKTR
jgi:uncharacterized RDD family membrane protein YckC